MESSGLITGTIGMLTLAGGLIGVYVMHTNKLALAKQEIDFLNQQHNKLEERVTELENKLFKKLDEIQRSITSIEINNAKK